jgi:hypothetical protein
LLLQILVLVVVAPQSKRGKVIKWRQGHRTDQLAPGQNGAKEIGLSTVKQVPRFSLMSAIVGQHNSTKSPRQPNQHLR